jgi:hypothetical protein
MKDKKKNCHESMEGTEKSCTGLFRKNLFGSVG